MAYTPFLITAELEFISRDNNERRVTTVMVTATNKKQQKAIQAEFPGKKYVIDTAGFNPMTHTHGHCRGSRRLPKQGHCGVRAALGTG